METSVQNGSVIFTHGEDRFTVTFKRTLRVPESGNTYALPPDMGNFPVKRVEDYKDKVPAKWLEHGGVFLPMWQREAMWMSFSCSRRPFACKVAAGKVNAISGKTWKKELAPANEEGSNDPRQDYCVAPTQRWIDGFNTGSGAIKQFVAMPLGQGYTVEGQVTGKEEFGGIQIMAVPPKDGLLMPKPRPQQVIMRAKPASSFGLESLGGPMIGASLNSAGSSYSASVGTTPIGDSYMEFSSSDAVMRSAIPTAAEMGLAAGGSIEQKIYPDPHGLDTWDEKASGRLFVHIVNSEMYEQITGEKPPKSPVTAATYASYGYPWFKVWDAEFGDVSASDTLSGVKTISQKDKEHGFTGQQNDADFGVKATLTVGKPHVWGSLVKDGEW